MPDGRPSRNALRLSWVAQIIAAVILGQSLFFKFTSAPEAIHIFERLGVEPWGRYATGSVELATVILLLVPRTAGVGALLAIGLMVGAVGSHLTVLGINVQGDGGTLFGMAIVTLIAAVIVARIRRKEIPILGGSRE